MLGLLVFGSQDWPDPQQIELHLIGVYMRHGPFKLFSGGAEGTDTIAERWADRNKNLGVTKEIVTIDDVGGWKAHPGKRAAWVRNNELAGRWFLHDGKAEAVAFHFANSPGTKMMIQILKDRFDYTPEIYTEPDLRIMIGRTLDTLRKEFPAIERLEGTDCAS